MVALVRSVHLLTFAPARMATPAQTARLTLALLIHVSTAELHQSPAASVSALVSMVISA
jgi:hypothetical protein